MYVLLVKFISFQLSRLGRRIIFFVEEISTEQVVYARQDTKHWGQTRKQWVKNPCLCGIYKLVGIYSLETYNDALEKLGPKFVSWTKLQINMHPNSICLL